MKVEVLTTEAEAQSTEAEAAMEETETAAILSDKAVDHVSHK